jgi:hypothetical protein
MTVAEKWQHLTQNRRNSPGRRAAHQSPGKKGMRQTRHEKTRAGRLPNGNSG